MMFKLLDRPRQPRGRLTLFYSINLQELESLPLVVKSLNKYSLMFFFNEIPSNVYEVCYALYFIFKYTAVSRNIKCVMYNLRL